ncbi:MAG: NUDIX domain-containing protein [Blastocatellia bacterium]
MHFGTMNPEVVYRDRPAAYAVIVNERGQIAAVKIRRGYLLPGGGTDPGETPEQTVRRELREELAREIHLVRELGEAVQYFSLPDVHYRMTAVFYQAEFASEQQGACEHELHWVERGGIAGTFFYASHEWAITRAE